MASMVDEVLSTPTGKSQYEVITIMIIITATAIILQHKTIIIITMHMVNPVKSKNIESLDPSRPLINSCHVLNS